MKIAALSFIFFIWFSPLFGDFSWDGVDLCKPMFVKVSFPANDPSEIMGVSWQTKGECDSKALFGFEGAMDSSLDGTHFRANGDLMYLHEVVFRDLVPATEYLYKVGDGTNWSSVYSFKTAPEKLSCDEFTFVVASDSRADFDGDGATVKWANIMSEALQHDNAAFLMNGGDMVKNGEDVQEWLNFLDVTPEVKAEKPIMIVLGNHDDGPGEGDDANYNQIFQFPRNSLTETEDSYYFTYGNALIVSLSTSTYFHAENGAIERKEAALWLDSVLETHRDMMWKIVFIHHVFYSSAGVSLLGQRIGHEMNEMGENEHLIPIIDKHHVDMAISAHSHYYERFKPSKGYTHNDDPDKIAPNPVDFSEGTYYVVSGGGGAVTFQDVFVDLICRNALEGSEFCGGKNHYLKFNISANKLAMEAWATSHQLTGVDESNHEMIDLLEIVKNEECVGPVEENDEDSATGVDSDELPDDDTSETPESKDTPDEIATPEPDNAGGSPNENENSDDTALGDPVTSGEGCSCSIVTFN